MQSIPIHIAAVRRAGADDDFIAFVSSCPTCGHQRLQSAYTRNALVHLLKAGADIAANCITCDVLWAITACERADIVRALVG